MKRSNTAVIILSALSLGVFCAWKFTEDAKKADGLTEAEKQIIANMSDRGPLVYALRDIEKGSIVTADSLETREVDQCKIPGSAVSDASTIIGRRIVYGIDKGQILSNYDFLLPGQSEEYRNTLKLPPRGHENKRVSP